MAFTLKKNDTRPILQITLTEILTEGGAPQPINLTSADSVKFVMKNGTTTVTKTATVTNAPQGIITVTFVAADTAVAGDYDAEVEITWDPNLIETVPNKEYFTVTIKDDLG